MTKSEYYANWRKFEKLPYDQQVADLNSFIEEDRRHWMDIYENGCHDPCWEDGTNMNLVRNHIINWIQKLFELDRAERQMTMFEMIDSCGIDDVATDGRIPPKVPNDFMAVDRVVRSELHKATKKDLHFD